MTRIQVKGFKIFADRHGKTRCYHRRTRHKIDLDTIEIGSAEFFSECQKIQALSDAIKAKEAKPGTLGGLIAYYYSTEHFKDTLSDRTRSDYRRVANYLAPIANTPVTAINTPLIASIHDRAARKMGFRQANMLRTFMSEVFRHGIPKGLIAENFAKDVILKPRPKALKRPNRPWTVDELVQVLDLAPPHIAAAIALIANTGLDPSDALNLLKTAISDGVIWADRGKTGQSVAIPIPERLQDALDAAPPHDAPTILASSKGQRWTYNGFSTVWHRFKLDKCTAAGLPNDLTLKGLRHTMATILRESGANLRQIADLLGQKTESMAHHYSRDAQLAARNRETMDQYQSEVERREKVVKPFAKSVKPQSKGDAL
jgi:integrase